MAKKKKSFLGRVLYWLLFAIFPSIEIKSVNISPSCALIFNLPSYIFFRNSSLNSGLSPKTGSPSFPVRNDIVKLIK